MVTARRRSARSGRSRKEPAPAICEERGTYILLLASCCSGCRRGGGGPAGRVGPRPGAGAGREDQRGRVGGQEASWRWTLSASKLCSASPLPLALAWSWFL